MARGDRFDRRGPERQVVDVVAVHDVEVEPVDVTLDTLDLVRKAAEVGGEDRGGELQAGSSVTLPSCDASELARASSAPLIRRFVAG